MVSKSSFSPLFVTLSKVISLYMQYASKASHVAGALSRGGGVGIFCLKATKCGSSRTIMHRVCRLEIKISFRDLLFIYLFIYLFFIYNFFKVGFIKFSYVTANLSLLK